jgi:hypothetical protein
MNWSEYSSLESARKNMERQKMDTIRKVQEYVDGVVLSDEKIECLFD